MTFSTPKILQLTQKKMTAVVRALSAEKKRRAQERRQYNWSLNARPSQKEPAGDWLGWLILAGRGFGKTRTGAETVRAWVESGRAKRICLLGDTLDEARAVMVEGNSGLLSVCPPWNRPVFQAEKAQLIWPCGAVAQLHSAHSYEKLRGPQFDGAWIDELAKFPQVQEAWDQLMMGLRLGSSPRAIITTTPRPLSFLKDLMQNPDIHVTQGSTFENQDNLSPTYIQTMKNTYGGTDLGAQELSGAVLDRPKNALWTPDMIQKCRLPQGATIPDLTRCIVAVDPAVTGGEKSDETGIIVAGTDAEGTAYILDDVSVKAQPAVWARRAADAYHLHRADALVAEVNNGGDLVQQLIHSIDPVIHYQSVRASRGKYSRAQPAAALYRLGRVRHRWGLDALQEQMLSFSGGDMCESFGDKKGHSARKSASGKKTAPASPDRLDALVWALFQLCLNPKEVITSAHAAITAF